MLDFVHFVLAALERRQYKMYKVELRITVLKFDSAAAAQFQHLRSLRLRVGTMDLRIAAIALAHDAAVLTRNIKDFSRVPNLRAEDWTV